MAGIRTNPETVHEVKVRAKQRKGMRWATNKSGKDAVIFMPIHPKVKRRRSKAHGKHEEEKDKRTQDLRLVLSRPAGMGIKREQNSGLY